MKLFGEHAVVYGKTAVAMAIDRYATASAKPSNSNLLTVDLKDLGKKITFDQNTLISIYGKYRGATSISGLVHLSELDKQAVPFAVMAGRLMENGMPVKKEVRIESDIPMQKGYASSAAISTAFVLAMLGEDAYRFDDNEIIDIARDGDRVIHQNKGAGIIDVSTAYYGAFVSFSQSSGINLENFGYDMKILVIDTGPKLSTSITVGKVSEAYGRDRAGTAKILDRIDECSRKGIEALRNNDIKELGRLMYENHELLVQLGVSTEKLDNAVKTAMECGAYGAKLSGGGGGGIAIAISDDISKLKERLREKGLNADTVKTAARRKE